MQPVRALSSISHADGYAKGIPPRFYISYQGTHLGLIDGLRSVLPSPMLAAVYLEPDGSPIETSIMLGYHGTVLRTSYARCETLYGLYLPYPGEWVWRMGRQDQFSEPSGRLNRTLLRLQNAETTQLDGILRSLALSLRLLVVCLPSTNDSTIPLDFRRACSILEHQTDDRKFIKHYDYHSEAVLRCEENPRILNWGPSQPHPQQTWGSRLLSQGKGRVPRVLKRVETNVNFSTTMSSWSRLEAASTCAFVLQPLKLQRRPPPLSHPCAPSASSVPALSAWSCLL